MSFELTPAQERQLHQVMRRGRFHSLHEALDALLRSTAHADAAATAPARRTPAQAAARIRELRKGTFLPKDMTIRSIIDEGRA